jgi:L-asparaginase
VRAISTRAAPGHETAGCTVRSDCGHDFHRELKVQPSIIRPVPRPRIVVLATGGTIASTLPHAQARAQDYAVTRAAGDLLSCVPQAGQIADLHCIDLMSLPSHDIGNEELLAIAREVQTWLGREDIDGLVITHGTDSLEETAFFLHLVIQSEKPVVLTGSMRPSDHLSPDGPANLLEAIAVAASPLASGRGVLVVMNDAIMHARSCSKQHTSSVAAFDGWAAERAGSVMGADVAFDAPCVGRQACGSGYALAKLDRLPVVDVIFDHQSARSSLYEASVASGSAGIVIAGMGNGSLSPGANRGARYAGDRGVAVVRASRCGRGLVTPLAMDDELLTIAGAHLSPQKARILLMVALAHGAGREELTRQFAEY